MLSELASIIRSAQERFAIPAVSVRVIKGDQTVFERGFGTCCIGQEQKVNEHTSYAIASMSKSMTAAALALCAEKGKLDWNEKVQTYLPYFRLTDDYAEREIRVKDLLIHNSGLRSEAAGILWYGSDYSREEVIRRLRRIRPISGFRETYAYQNVGYLAAGLILEAVSGQSWEDFLAEHLFVPLQMTRTTPTLALRNKNITENIALPHAVLNGYLQTIPYRDHDNCGPAASVHSTAHDIGNYLKMFLDQGRFNGKQILSETSVQTLHTPRIIASDSFHNSFHPRSEPHLPAYGYGWHIQDYAGHREIWHTGGVDGMRCKMSLFPDDNFAVVILTNCENRSGYASILYSIYDRTLGLEPVDWVDIFSQGVQIAPMPFPQQIPNTSPSFCETELCGTYRDRAYGDISIQMESYRPVLRFTHSSCFTADLSHYHYNTWQLNWRDPYIPTGLVTFNCDSTGKPASLSFDQPDLLDVHFDELDPFIQKVE